MPAHVLTIVDASVKFGDVVSPIDPALLTDYKCQVTQARITATSESTTTSVPHTNCGPGSEQVVPKASSFTLNLDWLQDWDTPLLQSLSAWAFKNDASKQAFAIYVSDEDPPVAVGVINVVAGDYGGPAGEPATASVQMRIDGYPFISDVTGTAIRPPSHPVVPITPLIAAAAPPFPAGAPADEADTDAV